MIKEQQKVLKDINCLSQIDPSALPECSRYLLDINFSSLSSTFAEGQS